MSTNKISSKDFSVKKSRNGKGLFAEKNFRANTTLLQLKGKLITCYEDDNLDEETRSNTIRFNSELFLSPKNEIGNFINHSCDPNSKISKRNSKLYIVTIKPIESGSEINFDYSTVLARDDVWQMKCNCHSKLCRKTIKYFYSLPISTRKDYIRRGMVPKYILNIKG